LTTFSLLHVLPEVTSFSEHLPCDAKRRGIKVLHSVSISPADALESAQSVSDVGLAVRLGNCGRAEVKPSR
jgi:hypothetical protein